MKDVVLNFPEQLKLGAQAAKGFKLGKEYKRVVISGMGGSIIPGFMYLTYREHKNRGPGVPVVINNNYGLPSDVTTEDLVICISWSGTTEETISALKTALERGVDSIVITKGNELGQLAKENNVPLITLPDVEYPPRWSVGYMVGALFTVLGFENELDAKLDPKGLENSGKELAEKIGAKIPIIYTSYPWRKLGAMWKANINETAKTPAYWNYMPVMAHDELEMYEQNNLPLYPIILKDSKDQPRYTRNIDAAIAIFNELGYNYNIVDLNSSDKLLETILNNYILALWTSYYLANNLGVNPEDIGLIEKFKQLKK